MIYAEAHKGKTIFVSTHYMDEAEYCDRITIMVDGKIAALGTPNNLKRDYKANNISEIFLLLARGIKSENH